ncbi:MAG: hypothetical protein R3E95_08550 [Thiolinea sp.]
MTASSRQGSCPLCQRETALTFHHLIPRKLHRRPHYRKHYSREQLNQGIAICRQCHNAIHRHYDEMHLAKHLNSLETLQADPLLQRHFAWVGRQKIRL